jgi:serine/threonine protein kinase
VLKNEIDRITQLKKSDIHENIVKYYDIYDDEYYAYIVMEYCDSGDLSKILGRPVKEHYVKHYMKQILNGIKYLHDQDIIHCDIKPSNLLLTNNKKTIKICDFGFSKNMDDVNNIKYIEGICGTPIYMAPEIFKKKQYGYFTDIWSIGIIFYEMLYGERPFTQCTNITQLIKKLEKKIKIMPPKFTLNMVSEDCVVLLQSMLNKNMNERVKIMDIINHTWLYEYKCALNNDVAYSFNTFSHGIMKDNTTHHELNDNMNDDVIGNTNMVNNDGNTNMVNRDGNTIDDILELKNTIVEHKNKMCDNSDDYIFNIEI